jgi:hypothetical protein
MKTSKIYYGVLAVFCLAFLAIGTVSATAITKLGTGTHHNCKGGQFVSEKLLSNLTAKGCDVPAISAAVSSGDYPTAMTLMKEFRMAHPEAFPAHAKGSCSGHIGRQLRAQNQQQPNQTSG